ncbi:XdhC family protein [Streptomyces sp. B93]|uniref:XdhC family protein n=1 Tax=Streptomyces sp. B93 TaxID=2824875 RepID=UPI001FFC574E|nr:XdhC family protein [Streptomyces sp. B93]
MVHHLCGDDPVTLLVESQTTAPRLIVFGAIDFTAALTRMGALPGYRVTVCDARPVFATATLAIRVVTSASGRGLVPRSSR